MEDTPPSLPDERHFGQLRLFTRARGYGFIAPVHASLRDFTQRVFVHFLDVLDDEQYLRKGDLVSYDREERTDKPRQYRAVRVRRVRPMLRGKSALAD